LIGEADGAALIETAISLGEQSISKTSDMVSFACLDAVPNVSKIPLRIGVAALEICNYRVAVGALTKSYAQVRESGVLSNDLLALVALFYNSGGAARAMVEEFKERLKLTTPADRLEAFRRAESRFQHVGDFVVADSITQYIAQAL
jgi:hypothetical protein